MLPDYPASRDLALDDQTVFEVLFTQDPPEISEFTFTNLYGWSQAYAFRVCRFRNWVLLRSRQGLFPPLGTGDKSAAILELIQAGEPAIIRLPETLALAFKDSSEVQIQPDPDNADYLYRTDDLLQLKGRRYDGKRGLIRKFKNRYAYEYIYLTQELCEESLAFEELWCQIRECDQDSSLTHEREAIHAMLTNFDRFRLRGGAIRVKQAIAALALAEPLNPGTLVLHVLKALPEMNGLYQTMYQNFLKHEAGDFAWVNAEQDLGVPGLRQAKESYHPEKKIMKYKLSARDRL